MAVQPSLQEAELGPVPSKESWVGRSHGLLGGCREEAWRGWAEARCWGTSVPQNKHTASGDFLALAE